MAFLENVELQVTCAALGFYDNGKYFKEPDCLESIKDLIRFLKRDTESCSVRRGIGGSAIVQNDLIPLIKEYADDRILLETVLRLLVNLTQPARICFLGLIPEDKERRLYYLEIENQLQDYKQAFADEHFFSVLTNTLGDMLKLDWEHRHEEDKLLIERILILIRNVLHIPKNCLKEQRADGFISLHDQIIWAIHSSGMEDLILYMASSDTEKQFAMHIIEIITLMLREQSPELLANVGQNRTITEKEEDTRELENALEREIVQRKLNTLKCSTRHSTFGGTFIVRNMKSISDKSLITHQPLTATQNAIDFDREKVPRKKAKNRVAMTAVDMVRRSAMSIRTVLKSFCHRVVEMAYNPIMKTVREMLVRSKAQENDETYFIWMMKFMMEFVRRTSFKPELVCETLSSTIFHYITNQLEVYGEHMVSDKKEILTWSKRTHLALKAYHELLHNLAAMDVYKDARLRESSRVIKSNIFYTMEYREILLSLFKKFELSRQSKVYLTDLISANHLFLKLLEQFCKNNSHVVVEKKKKFKIKKNKKTNKKEEDPEELWTRVSGQVSSAIQIQDVDDTVEIPFDAASDLEVDQQKVNAMMKIQVYLRTNSAVRAINLIRAAREVWPEGQFGEANISPEDEFMALREICLADLGNNITEEDDENDDDDGENEELDNHYESIEQNFSFNDYILRFANPQVLKPFVQLLENMQSNSASTNHAIIKMLHRICVDANQPCILFQIRLFRIFHSLMQDPVCRINQYQEIRSFGKHLLRKFFSLAKSNDKLYMELFFWKSSRDAIELSDGYGSYKASRMKKLWSEEENEELQILYDECKCNDEMDVIDAILHRLRDRSKTRRQVIRQLTMLDIISGAKEIKKKKVSGMDRKWSESEIEGLKKYYAEAKFEQDLISFLIERLSLNKSRGSIIKKLLELGLVSDKKELRKKRSRQLKKGEGNEENNILERETFFVDEHDSANDSSEDEKQSNNNNLNSKNDYNNEDDDDDDDDDDEDEVNIDSYNDYMKSKISTKQSHNLTINEKLLQVRESCKKFLLNQGNIDTLKWFVHCLERTAEDKDEDDDMYAIPIVPLTKEQDEVFSNEHFNLLLLECGFKKPANEQEKFWRIPISLSSSDLRAISASIDSSIDSFTNSSISNLPGDNTVSKDKENMDAEFSASTSMQDDSASKKTNSKVAKRKRLEDLLENKRSRLQKSSRDSSVGINKRTNKQKYDDVPTVNNEHEMLSSDDDARYINDDHTNDNDNSDIFNKDATYPTKHNSNIGKSKHSKIDKVCHKNSKYDTKNNKLNIINDDDINDNLHIDTDDMITINKKKRYLNIIDDDDDDSGTADNLNFDVSSSKNIDCGNTNEEIIIKKKLNANAHFQALDDDNVKSSKFSKKNQIDSDSD